MDPVACRIANALAGNAADAAALEITLLGPELEFEDSRRVAVAGASFAVRIDDAAVDPSRVIRVGPGSRLTFGVRNRGARAYLAIAGGIAVPEILGSRSTHLVSRMGGVEGRSLRAGDRIPLGKPSAVLPPASELLAPAPSHELISLSGDGSRVTLRILADGQYDRVGQSALARLEAGSYRVGSQSDRMGFRFEGPPIPVSTGRDMLSDITPIGTLQLPPSGLPILLMADRQTTGGYPRLGTMISADLSRAAQLAPGDEVRFEVCSLAAARSALLAQESAIAAFERTVRV